jgi:hypothetical protein
MDTASTACLTSLGCIIICCTSCYLLPLNFIASTKVVNEKGEPSENRKTVTDMLGEENYKTITDNFNNEMYFFSFIIFMLAGLIMIIAAAQAVMGVSKGDSNNKKNIE